MKDVKLPTVSNRPLSSVVTEVSQSSRPRQIVAFRIEGYVIVSADGMLANPRMSCRMN